MERRQEIGSEFWDVSPIGKENKLFPESTQWFLSGRSALQAIIKDLKRCHVVAMPSWCCDSMIKPFIDAGFDIKFYPVYWKDGLIQEISLDSDVLFLMDYFGYDSPQPDLSCYKGIVIRDVTHSVFSTAQFSVDYCFGSLRKWCGVWTGGYAWTRDGHELHMERSYDGDYILFREKAMQMKNSYIHGEKLAGKSYLKIYENAEACLENAGIAPAAERDIWLSQRLDLEWIKSRRRINAEVLRGALYDCLIFLEMRASDCPMFVPIIVPNGKRDALRKYLIEKEIYCPIHWPISKYHRLDVQERFIYENEISLVCDQRYTEKDMHRVVNTIKMFWEEA